MKAGTLLLVMRDVVDILISNHVLDGDGNFSSPSIATDAAIANAVEYSLRARGIETPDKIDKVLKALPLILEIIR